MVEVLLGQQPVIVLQDTPTFIGTNDGTLWTIEADSRFVSLRTETGRQDRAGAFNVAHTGPVSAARIRAVGNYDATGVSNPMRLLWHIEGPTWSLSGGFLMVDEDVRNFAEWTFADSDATITYGGAFSDGIDWGLLAADLAAEVVRIDARVDPSLEDATVALHAFQLYVTEGEVVAYLRNFPVDHQYGFASPRRHWPPTKLRRHFGGYR